MKFFIFSSNTLTQHHTMVYVVLNYNKRPHQLQIVPTIDIFSQDYDDINYIDVPDECPCYIMSVIGYDTNTMESVASLDAFIDEAMKYYSSFDCSIEDIRKQVEETEYMRITKWSCEDLCCFKLYEILDLSKANHMIQLNTICQFNGEQIVYCPELNTYYLTRKLYGCKPDYYPINRNTVKLCCDGRYLLRHNSYNSGHSIGWYDEKYVVNDTFNPTNKLFETITNVIKNEIK